jgi:hypothetical protein
MNTSHISGVSYSFYNGLPNLQAPKPTEAALEDTSQNKHDAKACDAAYSKGYDIGYNDALNAVQSKNAELEKVVLQINQQLSCNTQDTRNALNKVTTGVAQALHHVLTEAFPVLRKQLGMEVVVGFLKEVAPKIQSNVTVEVNSEMANKLKVWLCQDKSLPYAANDSNPKQMNIVKVVERDDLQYGDVRIEFGDCGVERILEEYERALGALIEEKVCKSITRPT